MMADSFNMDAYSPQQIAERVDNIGVTKARLPLLSMAMLGMLLLPIQSNAQVLQKNF